MDSLEPRNQRPEPFSAFTAPEFWDDDHISERMLAHHLDPDSPLASRTHAFIDRSVEWMVKQLGFPRGSRVLDLGCGPGLYATRLASRGIEVTGVDVSRRSIAYVTDVAARENLPITTIQGSYLDLGINFGGEYDAAILIYEDDCAMSPVQRSLLLKRVCAVLKTGGRFVFDVPSAARLGSIPEQCTEADNLMNAFWSREPHRGRHETFTYPEDRLVLDRYTIRTASDTQVFWNWTHCLTPAEVRDELTTAEFSDVDFYSDVAGAMYDDERLAFAVGASC